MSPETTVGVSDQSPPENVPVGQAAALGALQGPAEVLPVSSSAHLYLVPWLLRWSYADLDPDLRKSFEVAAHGGTALALVLADGSRLARAWSRDRPDATAMLLSLALPAAAGLALEHTVVERLGGPQTIAAGLAAGSVAMLWVDRRPGRRDDPALRVVDGLALGIAQSVALIPGVSRMAATLVAARARGFDDIAAAEVSNRVGMPVLIAVSLLKALRLLRHETPPQARKLLAAGFLSSLVSTLASARLIPLVAGDTTLRPSAAYRLVLAAATLAALRARSPARRGRAGSGGRAAAASAKALRFASNS